MKTNTKKQIREAHLEVIESLIATERVRLNAMMAAGENIAPLEIWKLMTLQFERIKLTAATKK